MCLIAFAWRAHAPHRLILVANRDEFYDRPTAPAEFWPDQPQLLAGRDLGAGGTWLGFSRDGRFAAVTNFREPGKQVSNARSRGELVVEYLRSQAAPTEFLAALAADSRRVYNGFNLIAGDGEELCYWSNRGGPPRCLEPGLYGLSNHLLDTPWPKLVRAKQRLAAWLAGCDGGLDGLAELMADRTLAPDPILPHTGVTLEWERLLSPMLIHSESYGTRSTTALTWNESGGVDFFEVPRGPDAGPPRHFTFEVAAAERAGARPTSSAASS